MFPTNSDEHYWSDFCYVAGFVFRIDQEERFPSSIPGYDDIETLWRDIRMLLRSYPKDTSECACINRKGLPEELPCLKYVKDSYEEAV